MSENAEVIDIRTKKPPRYEDGYDDKVLRQVACMACGFTDATARMTANFAFTMGWGLVYDDSGALAGFDCGCGMGDPR